MLTLTAQTQTIPLKALLNIPDSGYQLAIVEDGRFFLLFCATESQTEAVMPAELRCGEETTIGCGLVNIEPHWHLLGYQKHLNVGGEVIQLLQDSRGRERQRLPTSY